MFMEKVRANDPCPCGSGRKYKRCCRDKRSREQTIYVGHKEKFEGVRFHNCEAFVRLPSGEEVKTDAVFSRTEYTRKSGKDKVLSSIPNKATMQVHRFLASEFDAVWAIDTNTKIIGNDAVSVSCIFECYAKKNEKDQRMDVRYRKNGNLLFKNRPDDESEKFAWFRLVTMIVSSQRYHENLRIAIVTDHDLNKHSKYNSGKLPIYRDFRLPRNFTLLYASSDAGKEQLLNMLIAECDRDASRLLKELAENGNVTIGNSIISLDQIPSRESD